MYFNKLRNSALTITRLKTVQFERLISVLFSNVIKSVLQYKNLTNPKYDHVCSKINYLFIFQAITFENDFILLGLTTHNT